MVKYFYAGGQRVAMKKGSTVYFLLSDHLGSTTVTANSSAALEVGELRYKAWGETRYASGTTYTARHFTGQIDETSLGLYYYGARYYDSLLGRFIQADTIVPEPGNPQAWDRFAYALNSPVKYTDPSGHYYYDPGCDCMVHNKESKKQYKEYLTYERKENPIDLKNSDQLVKGKDNVAVGFRIENSSWAFGGFDINLDVLMFFETLELGIFITPGAQTGIGGGRGVTFGILYGENVPKRSSYGGYSVSQGATIPILPLNIEGDQTQSTSINTNGTSPTVNYFGVGPFSLEGGVYVTPSYTFDIVGGIVDIVKDLLSFLSGK